MSELSEIMSMIHKEREESDARLILSLDKMRDDIRKDIALSHAELKEETRELIKEMLPLDHSTDHDTVKMIRRWGTSFLSGLFGNMGKAMFFIMMIALGLQIMNSMPITEALKSVQK